MKYLIPFLTALILCAFFILALLKMGKKIIWKERKEERHIHKKGVLRLGGVAMFGAFLSAVLLNRDLFLSPEIVALVMGLAILTVFGVFDDIREIYWKFQMFFQFMTAILVFIFGIRIYYVTNPLTGGIIDLSSGMNVAVSVMLVIFWIILIVNCVNWLDGIDGLSGGVSFIAVFTIFFLSLKAEVFQPPIAIIAVALSGCILAFLFFNFNPARIMAGTSGAMFMGFSIAILSIVAGTKIATALLVLAIPIIDLFWVVKERIRRGVSIFKADRSHLHYKLIELGWSQRQVAFFYWGVTFLISMIALNTRAIGKGITMFATFLIMIAAYFFIERKINEKNNKQKN